MYINLYHLIYILYVCICMQLYVCWFFWRQAYVQPITMSSYIFYITTALREYLGVAVLQNLTLRVERVLCSSNTDTKIVLFSPTVWRAMERFLQPKPITDCSSLCYKPHIKLLLTSFQDYQTITKVPAFHILICCVQLFDPWKKNLNSCTKVSTRRRTLITQELISAFDFKSKSCSMDTHHPTAGSCKYLYR